MWVKTPRGRGKNFSQKGLKFFKGEKISPRWGGPPPEKLTTGLFNSPPSPPTKVGPQKNGGPIKKGVNPKRKKGRIKKVF